VLEASRLQSRWVARVPVLLWLLALSTMAQAEQAGDFTYHPEVGQVTLTGYTGTGGAVTIPASVTIIGNNAFESCTSLRSASFTGNAPLLSSYVFDYAASGFNVYYPK